MPASEKNVPRAACRMTVGEFQLGSNGSGAKSAPLSMIARSPEPIAHWFWGNVVHDLSGLKLHKSRLAIDYCHDVKEVVGYLNKFDGKDPDGLRVSGALTPFKDGDRASEILHKQSEGVPYEASIDFTPSSAGDVLVEYVDAGQVATVNGRQFAGPLTIVRQWTLRGVALCPYGADKNTEAQFTSGGDVSVAVATPQEAHPVSTQSAEAGATSPAVEAAPAAPAAPAPQAEATPAVDAAVAQAEAEAASNAEAGLVGAKDDKTPAAGNATGAEASPSPAAPQLPAVEAKFSHRDYTTAFGAEGAVWFLEGKSFADCAKLHADKLAAERDQLRQQLTDANARLAAAPRGDAGVSGGPGQAAASNPAEQQRRTNLGENTARFASGIRIAGAQPTPSPTQL